MKDLKDIREEINETDRMMAELFCRRMAAVREVAAYKKAHGLDVTDEGRERAVIERNASYIEDDELRSYYITYLRNTMAVSRSYQHRLLEGMRVACSGAEGAFAHIAAQRIFPDGRIIFFGSFADAYRSVEEGKCDCCVLPIENSYAGEVTQVTDLVYRGDLHINSVYDLQISHSLLGVPGAVLSDIRTVASHPQALNQCEEYIRRSGFGRLEQENTAVAARMVAEQKDRSVAAIASSGTAALYGLEVLEHDINESSANTTRFAVFSSSENISDREDSRFIMLFTVRNEAGALAEAINIIGAHGFNMRVLRSRPVKDEPWKYYFYVEAEGNAYDDNARSMMEELSHRCEKVKIAGSFSGEARI